ncbi:MAG: hypothetical protein AAFO15_00655 [Pseudomonadota bacterium]
MNSTLNEIRLKLPAGAAKPSPALARILGPLKVNPNDFCSKFNELTTDKVGINKGDVVVAGLIAKNAKSFDVNIYGIDISRALLKGANLTKGSSMPGKGDALIIKSEQIDQIVNNKFPYIHHVFNRESVKKSVIATANSCGIKVQ